MDLFVSLRPSARTIGSLGLSWSHRKRVSRMQRLWLRLSGNAGVWGLVEDAYAQRVEADVPQGTIEWCGFKSCGASERTWGLPGTAQHAQMERGLRECGGGGPGLWRSSGGLRPRGARGDRSRRIDGLVVPPMTAMRRPAPRSGLVPLSDVLAVNGLNSGRVRKVWPCGWRLGSAGSVSD